MVARPILVDLPVHVGRARVDLLHPVHADVADARVGSCVITAGSVMNGAGSPGQQRWIGNRSRLTSSPVSTISWLAPRETVFGSESAIDFSFFRPRTLSRCPAGPHLEHVLELLRDIVEPLDSERQAHPRLGAELIDREGMLDPFGRSNRSAGPPALTVRSTISVISRYGSASAETRTSSPSSSSRRIRSRGSPGGVIPRRFRSRR